MAGTAADLQEWGAFGHDRELRFHTGLQIVTLSLQPPTPKWPNKFNRKKSLSLSPSRK